MRARRERSGRSGTGGKTAGFPLLETKARVCREPARARACSHDGRTAPRGRRPAMGAYIADHYGNESVFLCSILLIGIDLVFIALVLPESLGAREEGVWGGEGRRRRLPDGTAPIGPGVERGARGKVRSRRSRGGGPEDDFPFFQVRFIFVTLAICFLCFCFCFVFSLEIMTTAKRIKYFSFVRLAVPVVRLLSWTASVYRAQEWQGRET